MQGNTASFSTDEDREITSEANRSIERIDDETKRSSPELENQETPVVSPKEEPAKPIDPRASKLEEIAQKRNDQRNDELEQQERNFIRPNVAPAPAEPKDDDTVDLKVRKQPTRLTIKERNEVLKDDFEEADIKQMSESEKNRATQQILTNRQYRAEMEELKAEKREFRTSQQQSAAAPQQPAAQVPVEQPKTPMQIAHEKVQRATEAVSFGEDGAAQLMIEAQEELASIKADERIAQRESAQRSDGYDADVRRGFKEADRLWEKDHPQLMNDPVARGAIHPTVDILSRISIGEFIRNQPREIQQRFTSGGITPDYIKNATPAEISGVYKSMATKGYQIPPPSYIVTQAANVVASRLAGNTSPAAQEPHLAPGDENGQRVILDRSGRKDEIANQPNRAGVPRPIPGTKPAPMSEQERARHNIEVEKQKRRGIKRQG